jgi:tRNA modification GTPase
MDQYTPQDSIAALATPWGESALAVLRLSGQDSLTLLEPLLEIEGKPLSQSRGFSLRRGRLRDVHRGGAAIDEIMIAVYHGPKSYTGENSAELFTHGSPAIIRSILELLLASGFRSAGPGEFTLRAFLNGKMDLTQAEAVNEIVRAKTDRARAIALNRLSGSIEREIGDINQSLARILSAVEVRIDYPDEDLQEEIVSPELLDEVRLRIDRLLDSYGIGKILQEGITAVLAGTTNAGKSTLFNRLLREDRAIVSELHGTTRDYLEGVVSIQGIPIRLIDTAGYRERQFDEDPLADRDPIEAEGIKRTDQIIENAHLVLYLVDGVEGIGSTDRSFLDYNARDSRLIRIWNKADASVQDCPERFIALSAQTGFGLSVLSEEIAQKVWQGRGPVDTDSPIIDSLRQKELLKRAQAALALFRDGLGQNRSYDLLAVDLKEAVDALGEISGQITSQDILNTIFSRFCVGK